MTTLNAPGYNQAAEDAIKDQLCSNSTVAPQDAAIAGAIFSMVVEPLIKSFVDHIDAQIKKELEKYTATYGSLASTDALYTDAFTRELAMTCIRFTRSLPDNDGKLVPTLDLIAQVRNSKDGGALQIRPLRLYYGAAQAKGDQFGLAISIKADAVWRDGNASNSAEVFNHILHTGKHNFTGALSFLLL